MLGEAGHSKPGGGEREVGDGGIGEDGAGEEVEEGGGCKSGLGEVAAAGGGDVLVLFAAAGAGEEVGVFAGEPTVDESCTW